MLNQEKIEQEAQWDGLKGYLTNSEMDNEEVLDNYRHLWQIEKAFRIAKIRPVFQYKKRRIKARICLNFAAYKVYKYLERQLKEKNADLSTEKVIEIIQSIYKITAITSNNKAISQTILLTQKQQQIQSLI